LVPKVRSLPYAHVIFTMHNDQVQELAKCWLSLL
jgi:hypothetical protein